MADHHDFSDDIPAPPLHRRPFPPSTAFTPSPAPPSSSANTYTFPTPFRHLPPLHGLKPSNPSPPGSPSQSPFRPTLQSAPPSFRTLLNPREPFIPRNTYTPTLATPFSQRLQHSPFNNLTPDSFGQSSSAPVHNYHSHSQPAPPQPLSRLPPPSTTTASASASATRPLTVFAPQPMRPLSQLPPMSPPNRSSYIDLTSTSSSNAANMPQARNALKRSATSQNAQSPPEDGASSRPTSSSSSTHKRQRIGGSSNGVQASISKSIPAVNLVEEDSVLETTLKKQRSEAVKAQQAESEKPQGLTHLTCVICLDTPTDLTATSCGHLFCHECLTNALNASETRANDRGDSRKSQCPVCRKNLRRPQDITTLLLKKGLASQPRRSSKSKPALGR